MKRHAFFASLLALSASVFANNYPVLTNAQPESVGFNIDKLKKLDSWIQDQINAGYPGMNVVVIKDNHRLSKRLGLYKKIRRLPFDG